jgi:hypothetical protein
MDLGNSFRLSLDADGHVGWTARDESGEQHFHQAPVTGPWRRFKAAPLLAPDRGTILETRSVRG